MCAKWVPGYDVNLLMAELARTRSHDASTGDFRGFESWHFDDVEGVLLTCVSFSPDMPEVDRSGILFHSALEVGKSKVMTPKAYIAEVSKRERNYWRQKERRFVLTTSISIRPPNPLRSTRISNCHLTFGARLPPRFEKEHAKASDQGRSAIFGDPPKAWPRMRGYSPVRVSVRAPTETVAFESAMDALDLLRGTWNLRLNSGGRMSSGKRKPVNALVLGPIHSLPDWFWYEPDYVEPVQALRLASRESDLREWETTVRSRLSKSRYRGKLEDAIRRHARVLDTREWNSAFVQMWSLLEHLTDSTNDPNRVTAKRASFLWKRSERPFHSQVLKHLMEYRNRTVHAGITTDRIETLLYQVKRYVDQTLLFHVGSASTFSSISEAAEYMDVPSELPELRRRRGMLERALKYHA